MTVVVKPKGKKALPSRKSHSKQRLIPMLYYVILSVLSFLALIPIVPVIFNAFKSQSELGNDSLGPPPHLRWENIVQAWIAGNFATTMTNSVILVIFTVVGVWLIAGMGAYAMSHLKLPGTNGTLIYIIAGSALPAQLYIVPLYFMWVNIGLVDTLLGLSLIYIATSSPFAVLLLRAYLMGVPNEFREAALVDGASEFFILWRIIIPLAWPGFLTVGLLTALETWNEFYFANIFIISDNLLPVQTSFLAFTNHYQRDLTLTSAAALFILLPVVALFLVMQRRFINGIAAGGIKI